MRRLRLRVVRRLWRLRRMVRRVNRRASRAGEAGFTALEVTIAMAMLLVVIMGGFTAVGTVLKVGNQALTTRQAGAVAALTMTNLREEAVSANILFNPATEGANAGTNPDE